MQRFGSSSLKFIPQCLKQYNSSIHRASITILHRNYYKPAQEEEITAPEPLQTVSLPHFNRKLSARKYNDIFHDKLSTMNSKDVHNYLLEHVSKIAVDYAQNESLVGAGNTYTIVDPLNAPLGTHEMKAYVLQQVQTLFGREIPSYELPKMRYVRDIVKYFTTLAAQEKPVEPVEVPKNVYLFLEQAKKKQRDLQEKTPERMQEAVKQETNA